MSLSKTQQLENTLLELNLTGPFDADDYYHTMQKRFGRNAKRFMDAVDDLYADFEGATAKAWQRLYHLKNTDKEMSVYVSAHQCSSLYRSFLTWLLENVDSSPKRIIELGCENGLLTLAIGNLYPTSEVIGVDMVGKAISAAKQLRKQHQIDNTEFRLVDLAKPSDALSDEADLIIAPWVMHDLLPCTADGGPISKVEESFLDNLRRLCRAGGSLVTVNRFPYSERQVPILINCLAGAGFEPTTQTTISAAEGDQMSRFPLVCFAKTE